MAASTKKSMAGNKRKLADLSMDEFLEGGFDSLSSSDEDMEVKKKSKKQKKKENNKPQMEKIVKGEKKQVKNALSDSVVKVKKGKKGQAEKKQVQQKHKSTKDLLKEQDPEFLDFLEGEDQSLLEFDMSDFSGSSSDEEVDIEDNKVKTKGAKKSTGKKAKQQLETEKKNKKSNQKSEVRQEKVTPGKKVKGKMLMKKQIEEEEEDEDDEDIEDEDIDNEDEDEDMGDSEEDELEEDFDMDASDSDDEEMLHKPPDELEEMSGSDDDEDDEDDDELEGPKKKKKGKSKGIVVTMAMIEDWTDRFKTSPSPPLLHETINAFKAAVQHTAAKSVPGKYTVQGAKVFNAVVRMCLVHIPGSLQKMLDLPPTTDLEKPVLPSNKNKKWKKIRMDVKFYLSDLLQLLKDLSESNMINVLLKHIHKLATFYSCFSKVTNVLIKRLINVWSSGEETSRVLAFLSINRMIRIQMNNLLEPCVKQMYLAYVRNCKFTSPNMLPLINFMQRSYVEILALDHSLAYQYAFMYIRQLAIHLRNALATKKKESCQAVYNWQYVHCISLWSRVMSLLYPNEVMEPLIYPLVQVIIGTIKLVPTQRYYPLRFHCVRALTMISRATHTFIPVLPFILEVFEQTDFNKKHKSIGFRPFNFACILKFSKPQLLEKTFKDGLIDQLYELLLEHFHVHAHTIGFPELALPAILQLKEFQKKCKVGNFAKQMKQILDKVTENCRFITDRRRSCNIALTDTKSIERWEYDCQTAGTPIGKFYATWRKLRDRELLHAIATREQEGAEDKVPEIKRFKKATEEEKKEFSELFDSDSDDDGGKFDLTESFLPPDEKKQLKKERKEQEKKEKKDQKKKKGSVEEEDDDDYSDFDDEELEQLAGSGSDDSGAEYDDGHDDQDDDVEIDEDDVEIDEDDDEIDEDDEDDDEDDDDDEEEDDDVDDKEDVVKDFAFSSDDDGDD